MLLVFENCLYLIMLHYYKNITKLIHYFRFLTTRIRYRPEIALLKRVVLYTSAKQNDCYKWQTNKNKVHWRLGETSHKLRHETLSVFQQAFLQGSGSRKPLYIIHLPASLQYLQYKELSTRAKEMQSIHSSLECMEFIQARSMKAEPIQSGGEY